MGSEGGLLTGVEKDLHLEMQTWAPDFASRWFQDRTCQISAAEDAGWTAYRAFSGRR